MTATISNSNTIGLYFQMLFFHSQFEKWVCK